MPQAVRSAEAPSVIRDLSPRDARDRLIVALDLPGVTEAERLVARLGDAVSFYKIGMQLVFAGGLALVPALRVAGKRVFIDMKLLDIDNTVCNGAEQIARMAVNLTTVHAYPAAMRAAVEGRGETALGLLAVTVLTSMDDADLEAAGYRTAATSLIAARADGARAAGMDGIVCSATRAPLVRSVVGNDMLIVAPGIRPAGTAAGDQKSVATPVAAIRAGVDYVVVGRPVTQAADPVAAADRIVADIETALAE